MATEAPGGAEQNPAYRLAHQRTPAELGVYPRTIAPSRGISEHEVHSHGRGGTGTVKLVRRRTADIESDLVIVVIRDGGDGQLDEW